MSNEILWAYTRAQAEQDAGRTITDEEARRISKAIGYSTAPDAVHDVVFAVCGGAADEDEEDDEPYDDNDMENPYPQDREDGEGIHAPSYGE